MQFSNPSLPFFALDQVLSAADVEDTLSTLTICGNLSTNLQTQISLHDGFTATPPLIVPAALNGVTFAHSRTTEDCIYYPADSSFLDLDDADLGMDGGATPVATPIQLLHTTPTARLLTMQPSQRTGGIARQFACTWPNCEYSTITKSDVTKHMRKHTGERPFSCKMCKKTFKESSVCRRHMKRHTSVKPFACFECGQSFTRRWNKVRHVETMRHNGSDDEGNDRDVTMGKRNDAAAAATKFTPKHRNPTNGATTKLEKGHQQLPTGTRARASLHMLQVAVHSVHTSARQIAPERNLGRLRLRARTKLDHFVGNGCEEAEGMLGDDEGDNASNDLHANDTDGVFLEVFSACLRSDMCDFTVSPLGDLLK